MKRHRVLSIATVWAVSAALTACTQPPGQMVNLGQAPVVAKAGNAQVTASPQDGAKAAASQSTANATKDPKLAAKPVAPDMKTLSAARSTAAKAINMVSRLGDAALKVQNHLNGKPAIGNAGLTSKSAKTYVILQTAESDTEDGTPSSTPGATEGVSVGEDGATVNASAPGASVTVSSSGTEAQASGAANPCDEDSSAEACYGGDVAVLINGKNTTVKGEDGEVEAEVEAGTVTTETNANGEEIESQSFDISADAESGETGSEIVRDIKVGGKIKRGSIKYDADKVAESNGESDQEISYEDTDNDGRMNFEVSFDPDPTDESSEPATAELETTESEKGDITTEGDLDLPGSNEKVHVTIVIHPNGSKEITCLANDYSFVVHSTVDGVGMGTLYKANDVSENGQKIGVITLNKGDAQDEIRFYMEDGALGEPVKFKFNV